MRCSCQSGCVFRHDERDVCRVPGENGVSWQTQFFTNSIIWWNPWNKDTSLKRTPFLFPRAVSWIHWNKHTSLIRILYSAPLVSSSDFRVQGLFSWGEKGAHIRFLCFGGVKSCLALSLPLYITSPGAYIVRSSISVENAFVFSFRYILITIPPTPTVGWSVFPTTCLPKVRQVQATLFHTVTPEDYFHCTLQL